MTNPIEFSADSVSPFATLGLDAPLISALTALGYEEPTPIQREAIPPLLQGRDVLGQAATGTGKTAAFALPMLQRIGSAAKRGGAADVRGLILVPTRELAMPVAEALLPEARLALGSWRMSCRGNTRCRRSVACSTWRVRHRPLSFAARAPKWTSFRKRSSAAATALRPCTAASHRNSAIA